MAYIVVMSGEKKGQRYDLTSEETVLGRSSAASITVDDAVVSGQHCSIIRQGDRYILRDLDSTNGTRLNTFSIRESRLKPKDIITLGTTDLMIDGTDIEVEEGFGSAGMPIAPTVRVQHPGFQSGDQTATSTVGFRARTNRKALWVVVYAILGVIAVVALGWFLMTVFGSGS
jgi:hypothetical protein